MRNHVLATALKTFGDYRKGQVAWFPKADFVQYEGMGMVRRQSAEIPKMADPPQNKMMPMPENKQQVVETEDKPVRRLTGRRTWRLKQ